MRKTLHSGRSLDLRCRLRGAREAGGLTQADLAAQLCKPQSFVSKFELGERRLDVVEYAEICEILGIDPAQLLRDVLAGESGLRGSRAKRR